MNKVSISVEKKHDPIRITRYVYTMDDWCPNYGDHLVKVSFQQLYPSMEWRVNVWGNDDLGMDRDFKVREHAEHCFVAIINDAYLTFENLKARGFSRF